MINVTNAVLAMSEHINMAIHLLYIRRDRKTPSL